jgi:hypothetical protein
MALLLAGVDPRIKMKRLAARTSSNLEIVIILSVDLKINRDSI